MRLVVQHINLDDLKQLSDRIFGGLVKAVIDIEKKIMVVDAAMHADEEKMLLDAGSKQENLWGINLYPEFYNTDNFIEYDSMINIRPRQQNFSRSIENEKIQHIIKEIVASLVIA